LQAKEWGYEADVHFGIGTIIVLLVLILLVLIIK
jgi:hypothetical protein